MSNNNEKETITIESANAVVKNTEGVYDVYTADKNTSALTQRVSSMKGIGMAIKNALVEGINGDYAIVPGTNKPTLLQPGARKVALLFGLIPEYHVTDKDVNYDIVWKSKKWNKDTKSWYMTDVTGHFEYEIMVTLRTVNGQVIATGVGSCCNREKGKEEMPANSILKMAKKRAFVDAVLSIADLSSVFTQDMEDIKKTTTSSSSSGYTRKY